MNRDNLVRDMVLNEIADDYENVDQVILRNVASACARLGVAIDRSHIVKALESLVAEGMAKAYLLSSTGPPAELPGMPALPVEACFSTYFYITPRGMECQMAESASWNPQGWCNS